MALYLASQKTGWINPTNGRERIALVIFDDKRTNQAVCSVVPHLNGHVAPKLREARGIVRGDSIRADVQTDALETETQNPIGDDSAYRAMMARPDGKALEMRGLMVAANRDRAASLRGRHHGVLYEAAGIAYHNGYATLRRDGYTARDALAVVRMASAHSRLADSVRGMANRCPAEVRRADCIARAASEIIETLRTEPSAITSPRLAFRSCYGINRLNTPAPL